MNTSLLFLAWFLAVFFRMESGVFSGTVEAWKILLSHPASNGVGAFAGHWANASAGLAVFLAIQCAYIGAGYAVYRLFAKINEGSCRLVYIWPLGWAVSAMAVMGLAQAGLVFRPVLAVLLVLPAVSGAVYLGRHQPWRFAGRENQERFSALSVTFFVLVAGLLLVGVLAPETEGDVLCIHYGVPWQVLNGHKSFELPFTAYEDYPQLWEMMVLPLLGFGGEVSARFFGVLLVIFLAWQAFQLAVTLMPGKWAAVPACLVLTSPMIWKYALIAKNDLLVAVLGMTALLLVVTGNGRPGRNKVFLAGVFLGAMFAVKYTGGFIFPALLVAFYLAGARGWKNLCLFMAGFAVFVFPLLARNALNTGDPVFPLGSAIFHSPFSTKATAGRFLEIAQYVTVQDPSAMNILAKVRNGLGINPVSEESFARIIILLPAVLLAGALDGRIRILVVVFLATWAAWFLVPGQVRYGIFLFPAGYVLGAMGLPALGRAGPPLAVLLCTAQLWSALLLPQFTHKVMTGLGLEEANGYRQKRLATFQEAADRTNRITQRGERILGVGVNRIASFRERLDYGAYSGPVFPPFKFVHESRDENRLTVKFRQMHWDHILYNNMTAMFWNRLYADDAWTQRDLELWARFWGRHARLEWESGIQDSVEGHFYLFRITGKAGSAYTGVLPGIEGVVYLVQEDAKNGRLPEMMGRLRGLRRAAGAFGMVDYIEWGFLNGMNSRQENYRLLYGAFQKGFSNFQTLSHLAYLAPPGGMSEAWIKRALDRNPGSTRESLMQGLYGR